MHTCDRINVNLNVNAPKEDSPHSLITDGIRKGFSFYGAFASVLQPVFVKEITTKDGVRIHISSSASRAFALLQAASH